MTHPARRLADRVQDLANDLDAHAAAMDHAGAEWDRVARMEAVSPAHVNGARAEAARCRAVADAHRTAARRCRELLQDQP